MTCIYILGRAILKVCCVFGVILKQNDIILKNDLYFIEGIIYTSKVSLENQLEVVSG
jgi:hypothetical protein